jgi:hypothetical protein
MRWRFAGPEDAPALAKWAAENPDIPLQDARSLKNHPTTEAIVIEEDGKIVLILPFYAILNVAFFGFSPEASAKQKYKAMNFALEIMKDFATKHHIHGIQGFSKSEYLMAQWAKRHRFVEEERQAFVLTIPREQQVVN